MHGVEYKEGMRDTIVVVVVVVGVVVVVVAMVPLCSFKFNTKLMEK